MMAGSEVYYSYAYRQVYDQSFHTLVDLRIWIGGPLFPLLNKGTYCRLVHSGKYSIPMTKLVDFVVITPLLMLCCFLHHDGNFG